MKAAVAIKRYLEQDTDKKVSAGELSALKSECTQQEWQQMGKDACEALGVTYEQ